MNVGGPRANYPGTTMKLQSKQSLREMTFEILSVGFNVITSAHRS